MNTNTIDLAGKNIVVLTGAGISAESGLKTFRDDDGLWEGHRVEEVATPEAFSANPELVQTFYNQRRAQLFSGNVHPNAAHLALANFEAQHDGKFCLVTQNVDNLHRRAGSKNLFAMHGELVQARCLSCDGLSPIETDLCEQSVCRACGTTGCLRPHVVWFGEMPLYMREIEQQLMDCEIFVSIGTSSVVYPAAGFCQLAKASHATCLELNLEPSATASTFDHGIYGPASRVVPEFFRAG